MLTLLPTGDRAGKRKRAVYATTDPYADPAGELWERVTLQQCADITQGRAVPGWLIYVAGLDNSPAHHNILTWPADASAADPAAVRKQRLQQAAQEGRLHGPRPMPAGWKVVLRESKRDGRLLKRYRVRASCLW